MPITSRDIVPFNKARAELTRLADEVRAGHEKIITRNGESYVALIDARKLDYYHALERERQVEERLHSQLLEDAVTALEDIRQGRVMTPAEARESLRKRHPALADG